LVKLTEKSSGKVDCGGLTNYDLLSFNKNLYQFGTIPSSYS